MVLVVAQDWDFLAGQGNSPEAKADVGKEFPKITEVGAGINIAATALEGQSAYFPSS